MSSSGGGRCERARRRELEPEGRAFALGALDADASSVGFHDLLAEREAEAGAADRARFGGVDAEELLEDAGLLLGRNADSGSLIETRTDSPEIARADSNGAAVGEYLMALESRFARSWPMRASSPTISMASRRVRLERVDRRLHLEHLDLVGEKVMQPEGLGLQIEVARPDLLDVEELVDQAVETLCLAVDRLEGLVASAFVDLSVDQ